jgi:hypothetical protein
MRRDFPLDPLWEPVVPVPPHLAHLLGLPATQLVYRKLVRDGVLWAAALRDEHGWLFTVTHTQDGSLEICVPGRLPTLTEVYAARVALFTDDELLCAALEPAPRQLWRRWPGFQPDMTTPQPGLPTTILCVQVHIEDVTLDVVTERPADAPPPAHPLAPEEDEAAVAALADAPDED